jgi:GntR family transcriptional regulator
MRIEVDLRSGIPIYVQIMDQIKHLVATGTLQPDDQLPTVRQLAADLRVNFNTVARAYRLLDEEGLISTQHGRGTYILSQPTEENSDRLRRQDLKWLTRHYLNEASRLDYSAIEVREIFERYLNQWLERGLPPPEHEG